MGQISFNSPAEARLFFRKSEKAIPTAGLCPGYIQANLVILEDEYASEFWDFARMNPKPCPLLEVLFDGTPKSKSMAPCGDITTDIPKYSVYKDGELVEEPLSVKSYWNDKMIGFLIGCSLTFEAALVNAGIRLKHYEENKRVPMYDTNIECIPTKRFFGNYVVSMRPIKKELVDAAVDITSKMEYAHGAPVHIGDPSKIGIKDINHPDYGDALSINDDEVPVFWACGVTPQAVAKKAKPKLMLAHSPGYMLICDKEIL